ncbi:MAG: hypothetical protein PF440_02585, partial [Thiomicrorhabdus sp.]|nr:hypothetical protein [Thiomicrorhabdus sp.]
MKRKNEKSDLILTREELKDFLDGVKNTGYIVNYFSFMCENIKHQTEYLDDLYPDINIPTAFRINCIKQCIYEDDVPVCSVCNKSLHITKANKFAKSCNSQKCKNQIKSQKVKSTWNSKTVDEITEKRKLANIASYGVDNHMKSDKVKDIFKQSINIPHKVPYMINSNEHLSWSPHQLSEYLNSIEKLTSVSRNLPLLKQNIITSTDFLIPVYGNDIPFSFRANALRAEVYSSDDIPLCSVCNTNHRKMVKSKGMFSDTCSYRACISTNISTKSKKTTQSKYNVDHISQLQSTQDKINQTNIERYGKARPIQVKEIRDRITQTNIDTYGYASVAKCESVKDKTRQTNLSRYGTECSLSNPDVKKKALLTMEERYGYYRKYSTSTAPQVLNDPTLLSEMYSDIGTRGVANVLDCDKKTVYSHLTKHSIEIGQRSNSSYAEKQIIEFLESYGIECEQSNRTALGGKEIDIYIPSHKIGIEFDGLYWHSSKFKEDNYHLVKQKLADENGINLIQIFEDEWIHKQEIIKEKLKSILMIMDGDRVYARKCSISEAKNEETKEIYNNHHIQGHVNGSLSYVLLYNDVIVASMSFKRTNG